MLPSERQRRLDLARREDAGEILWTGRLNTGAGWDLDRLWRRARQQAENRKAIEKAIKAEFSELSQYQYKTPDPHQLKRAKADPEYLIDVLAAVGKHYGETFRIDANDILRRHRISWSFVGEELISRRSDELQDAVVNRVLKLPISAGHNAAQEAYLEALDLIEHDKPAAAITESGTALENMLAGLGCKGNALGPKVRDAKAKGLLGGADEKLTNAVMNICDWVSAERSTRGNAHPGSNATIDDAWLIVHVVGALIIRLAGPSPRSTGRA